MLALALYIPTLALLVLFSSSQEPQKALKYISICLVGLFAWDQKFASSLN